MAFYRAGGQGASGDAVAADVLLNKTFSNDDDTDVVGTMPNNGKVTPSGLNCGGSYTIPAGYHNGQGVVTANSLASQTGVDSGKTAVGAAQMLTGYQGWVNGSKITGTMANKGAWTPSNINPGGSVTIPAGYHNGNGKVTANANQNSGTKTITSSDANWLTGNVDMGANNSYRYVNAVNVYNKGKADGAGSIKVSCLNGGGSANATSQNSANYSSSMAFNPDMNGWVPLSSDGTRRCWYVFSSAIVPKLVGISRCLDNCTTVYRIIGSNDGTNWTTLKDSWSIVNGSYGNFPAFTYASLTGTTAYKYVGIQVVSSTAAMTSGSGIKCVIVGTN